jgi:hypothetical protein
MADQPDPMQLAVAEWQWVPRLARLPVCGQTTAHLVEVSAVEVCSTQLPGLLQLHLRAQLVHTAAAQH